MEAYIRSPIDYQEKVVMMRPTYTYADLTHFFEISRATNGVKKLLQFCFMKMPDNVEGDGGLITCCSTDEHYLYESNNTLQTVDLLLRVLENEFEAMGGVTAPDFNAVGTTLTAEDFENARMEKEARRIAMENKAIAGRHLAVERVEAHKKQAEFDMLDGDVQDGILRRREAEAESERHRVEREFYFGRAKFHRFKESAFTQWIRDSIYQGLMKNYKLKKSGVKMNLDQKHLYDKVVAPVEMVMKRILKQEPMVITVMASEKQSLMESTKAAAASVVMGGGKAFAKKALEEKKEKKRLEEEAVKKAADEEKNKKKKKKSKKQNDVDDGVLPAGALKLEDMTPLELDKAYIHCFEVFATRVTTVYCKCLNMSINDVKIAKSVRVSHNTAFQMRNALKDAEEKLKKSPVTALLPPVQFKEKVIVAAAKIMADWEIMTDVGAQLGTSFKMKDKAWPPKAVSCLTSCLIMKYNADEKNRLRGEAIAANMLQGLLRGYMTRCKLRRIWEAATRKYEKEYEKYKEDQLALKYLQEAEMAKAVEEKNVLESHKRIMLLKKIGVDWAEAYVHEVTVSSVVVQMNMRIGGKLPLKDYFRNKNVKCVARMFEPAEQLPDVNCTEYTSKMSSSTSTLSDVPQARIGQLEVLVDDSKAVQDQLADWNKYGENVILPFSIHWDSTTKLKKSKLINVFDSHDDGSDLDIATCFVTVNGLNFNACYNVKVNMNPNYNPASTYVEDRKAAVAVLEFVTSACPPSPPKLLRPDVIHFDHTITVSKDHKRHDDTPLLGDDEEEHDQHNVEDVNNDGLSVVDRLERFKVQQLEIKRRVFSAKAPKKAMKINSPTKQIIDRRVSCRLQWDIPVCNGSAVTQYELQRRADLNRDSADAPQDWITLTITNTNFYTDTLPQMDRRTGHSNEYAVYRVRAENAKGWGHFCHSFEVNIVDKLCNASACLPKGQKYAMKGTKQLLLPHGVTVNSGMTESAVISSDDDVSAMTDNSATFGIKILSNEEVKDILHSNMLCAPAPRPADLDSDDDDDDNDGNGTPCSDDDDFDAFVTTKQRKKGSKKMKKTGSHARSTVANDSARLKSVTLDPKSSLAGDSLDNVNEDLQLWLSRLANACPLDTEKEDKWQTRQRLAATEALQQSAQEAHHRDEKDKLTEDLEDEYDPYADIDNEVSLHTVVPPSTDNSKSQDKLSKGKNSSKRSKNNTEEATLADSLPLPPTPTKLYLSKSQQPLVMESVYKQSEKHLRNITECGEKSELDNVIQRLAMVHKKVPSKTHPPAENFKFTISPLPTISDKVI